MLLEFLRSVGKPTIAAVREFCVAGGNEIAMACDLVIASKNAKFGALEVRVGSTAMGWEFSFCRCSSEKKGRESFC